MRSMITPSPSAWEIGQRAIVEAISESLDGLTIAHSEAANIEVLLTIRVAYTLTPTALILRSQDISISQPGCEGCERARIRSRDCPDEDVLVAFAFGYALPDGDDYWWRDLRPEPPDGFTVGYGQSVQA
jgi:hypothetical protein